MTNDVPPKPLRALRRPGVLDRLAVGSTTLDEMMEAGRFRKPIKVYPGGRAAFWFEHWCDEYLAARLAAAEAAAAEVPKTEAPETKPKRKRGRPRKTA